MIRTYRMQLLVVTLFTSLIYAQDVSFVQSASAGFSNVEDESTDQEKKKKNDVSNNRLVAKIIDVVATQCIDDAVDRSSNRIDIKVAGIATKLFVRKALDDHQATTPKLQYDCLKSASVYSLEKTETASESQDDDPQNEIKALKLQIFKDLRKGLLCKNQKDQSLALKIPRALVSQVATPLAVEAMEKQGYSKAFAYGSIGCTKMLLAVVVNSVKNNNPHQCIDAAVDITCGCGLNDIIFAIGYYFKPSLDHHWKEYGDRPFFKSILNIFKP